MNAVNLKWAGLFLFLILFPASILTYVSVQALRDEQRSALADLNLLVPRLQNAFDQMMGEMAQADDLDVKVTSVMLDGEGGFVQPRVLPLIFSSRSQAFQELVLDGERIAFQNQDWEGANRVFGAALKQAQSDGERGEALQVLLGVALRQNRMDDALAYWTQLRGFPDVLDADGAHPVTLGVLQFTDQVTFKKALPIVEDWVDGVIEGRYPLFMGASYVVRRLQDWANRSAHRYDEARRIGRQLDNIAQWALLVDIWTQLRSVGMGDLGYVFRSGVNAQNENVLVVLKARADQQVEVVQVDVADVTNALMATPVGQEIAENGFALRLMDVDAVQDFKNSHQDVMHLITPASATLYRMNFGFYTRGDVQVFEMYRKRNTWILGGVVALAGLIGVGVFLMYRDITREVVIAKLRSDFVSNVSHELRTPLTSIRMYAETLFMKRYRDEAQVQTYLETIMQESQRLSRMVGNILDFSRIENGRKTYTFERCDPERVVQVVMDEFAPILQEQAFSVTLNVEPAVPVILADQEALETALANLLSNAVKYSRERKAIRLSVWRDGNVVVFEVADRGVGVPLQERKSIFEKFHRASNAGALATGTGLGLALVKGVMIAHRGSVTYHPREGGGSVFQLRVPVAD